MGFPGGTVVKNLPVNAGDTGDEGLITGWEDPLEQDMATDSSILAWKMPWTEEPGGQQSMGSQRVDTTEQLSMRTHKNIDSAFHRASTIAEQSYNKLSLGGGGQMALFWCDG